jgi:DNA-binding NarL/FixJ family response regulator
MSTATCGHTYVHELERRLQLTLFGRGIADPEGVVLLVRCALADGDRRRAAGLAEATQRLAAVTQENPDMAVAVDHARALIEQDPVLLERAASGYSAEQARAGALEDAGCAWARIGHQDRASALLSQAHDLYGRLGADDGMARVRSRLRAIGVRLCHWTHADRPASGWDSLTDTEWRVADLVAQGLSNREVASKIFLSPHTVAFHLRHVFWKLGVTSRVQLARMATENDAQSSDARSAG